MDLTERLKASIELVAGDRPLTYLQSSAVSKEMLVVELLRRERIEDGLVCRVNHTHRYHVSTAGRRVLPALAADTKNLNQLAI